MSTFSTISKLMLLNCLELGPWDIKIIWEIWNTLDSGILLHPELVPVPILYPLTSLHLFFSLCFWLVLLLGHRDQVFSDD